MYTLTYMLCTCNLYNYITNQAISVAKSCFYCVFSLKKIPHECGGHVTFSVALSFNFWGTHT